MVPIIAPSTSDIAEPRPQRAAVKAPTTGSYATTSDAETFMALVALREVVEPTWCESRAIKSSRNHVTGTLCVHFQLYHPQAHTFIPPPIGRSQHPDPAPKPGSMHDHSPSSINSPQTPPPTPAHAHHITNPWLTWADRIRNRQRRLNRLRIVEPRVAVGLIVLGQHLLGEADATAGALGDRRLAGELDVDAREDRAAVSVDLGAP